MADAAIRQLIRRERSENPRRNISNAQEAGKTPSSLHSFNSDSLENLGELSLPQLLAKLPNYSHSMAALASRTNDLTPMWNIAKKLY